MKKMYLGSAFLNWIRGLAVIIMSISLLSACGDEREDDTVVTKEDFVPVGLPGRVHMLCFETDSIGYAASPLLTKKNGRHDRDRFVVSKTSDRGRNWKAVGKIDGSCLNISECGRRIFVVSTNRYRRNYKEGRDISEIVVIDKDDLSSERIAVEYGDIWGFHIFNDSTYTYRLGRDENCSYIITRDYGRKWEKVSVPGRPVGYKVAFCGNTMFIPASVRADSTYRRILYAKDVISSNIRALKTGNLYDIQAADSLLAFYPRMSFRKYDGESLKYVSKFRWNGTFHGCYHPDFLTGKDGVFICSAYNFSADKGRHDCIFCSADGGVNWKPLLISDDIWQNDYMFNESSMSAIPEEDGVSVIYQCARDERLHIIKVQKSCSR